MADQMPVRFNPGAPSRCVRHGEVACPSCLLYERNDWKAEARAQRERADHAEADLLMEKAARVLVEKAAESEHARLTRIADGCRSDASRMGERALSAEARDAGMEAILREIEWEDNVDLPVPYCPLCREDKPKHAPDCRLALALAASSPASPPSGLCPRGRPHAAAYRAELGCASPAEGACKTCGGTGTVTEVGSEMDRDGYPYPVPVPARCPACAPGAKETTRG